MIEVLLGDKSNKLNVLVEIVVSATIPLLELQATEAKAVGGKDVALSALREEMIDISLLDSNEDGKLDQLESSWLFEIVVDNTSSLL